MLGLEHGDRRQITLEQAQESVTGSDEIKAAADERGGAEPRPRLPCDGVLFGKQGGRNMACVSIDVGSHHPGHDGGAEVQAIE